MPLTPCGKKRKLAVTGIGSEFVCRLHFSCSFVRRFQSTGELSDFARDLSYDLLVLLIKEDPECQAL